MIDLRNDTEEELMKSYNKYSQGLASAQMGDKRRYNTKMDITYNKAMLTMYEQEMKNRGLIQ